MYGIFNGLAVAIDQLMKLYMLAIVIAVVISLVDADPGNAVVQFFRRITEPLFMRIRRLLPFVVVGGFDLSPIVVWVVYLFLQEALVENLRHLGR
ncbi:MAG: YggT family protein [candidate division FCPU426 bacterium]